MGRGIRAFIDKHAKKFNEPFFTATIAGDHSLFIGDPDHLSLIYTHSKHLDSFALQKQFTRNVLGITEGSDEEETFSVTTIKGGIKQYHHYIFTDPELEKTIRTAQCIFRDLLPRYADQNSSAPPPQKTKSTAAWNKHNLYKLVYNCIFRATVEPLISKHIATGEMGEEFASFDQAVPLMFADAPHFLTSKAQKARDTLLEHISNERFLQEASDLMRERLKLGLSENVFNRSGLGLLFASVGNSIPSVFWVTYHVIRDPIAYSAIRKEIDEVIAKRKTSDGELGGSILHFTLDELRQMTLLDSAFTEALRLYHGAFTVREVVQDFVYDPKKKNQSKYLIEKGCKVMAFVATLHHDPELFPDPDEYQYDRFAPQIEDGKSVPKTFLKNGKRITEPIRPFGGGARLCPGRKFIRYEVQAFLALLLSSFDLRLVDNEKDPGINYSMQAVGISHPDFFPNVEAWLSDANTQDL
ncbi:hypothetical protein ACHAWF_011923 [Thalassiosira exigua]